MNASNQLKEKSFLYLLMAVDCREQRFCHIIIQFWVLPHSSDNIHLGLTHVLVNLLPDHTLIKYLLWTIIVFLLIFLLFEKLVELIILNFDIDGSEN